MNVFEKIREKLEEEKMKHFLTIANTGDDKLDFAYEKVGDALDEAIKIVNQVEEEHNNGWIPVEERLPSKEEYLKDDGRFIVTDGNRSYQSIYDIYRRCFRTLKSRFVSQWEFEEDKCVIAWQPLPEPYQKGE